MKSSSVRVRRQRDDPSPAFCAEMFSHQHLIHDVNNAVAVHVGRLVVCGADVLAQPLTDEHNVQKVYGAIAVGVAG